MNNATHLASSFLFFFLFFLACRFTLGYFITAFFYFFMFTIYSENYIFWDDNEK